MAESPRAKPIVIAGSGMAGANAAVTLRERGYSGDLIIVGEEPGLPFGRPPLSKDYLRGEGGLSGWIVRPSSWYEANRVEILEATAVSLDLHERRLGLASGASIPFGRLLIATGGRNRKLRVPGSDLPGIHQLRTVADCDAIRAAIRPGIRAVVVGMGFIGCEVAASLRHLGAQVTAILPGDWPLERVLGPEVGEVIAGVHADAGVVLIPNDSAASFRGDRRVEEVTTRSGRRIPCDLAVVAVGIEPNTEFLAGSGLAVDGGVLVDGRCRTQHPDVFAAGDVANHLHPVFGRTRVEHYNNAEKQGAAAARAMLGDQAAYDYIHSFWSDQYDQKLEYVGHAGRWDRFVSLGSLPDRRFIGVYLESGTIRAAVGLNRGGDPETDRDGELAWAARAIAARSPVSAGDLAQMARLGGGPSDVGDAPARGTVQ